MEAPTESIQNNPKYLGMTLDYRQIQEQNRLKLCGTSSDSTVSVLRSSALGLQVSIALRFG